MLSRSKQIRIAIIHDDRDTVAWLVEQAGAPVEFEHIGLARGLNRQEVLSILLAGVLPDYHESDLVEDLSGDINAYPLGQHLLTTALC